ncbi:cytochrome c5 family protein [Polaromonas sp.]|uniref:c-type cytochrome n=1 Tax=Polaromonas sp. TaxID=1869339 RepID=UPI003566431F
MSFVYPTTTHAAGPPHLAADVSTTGRALFEGSCIMCHGDDGKGSMPGVPDITGAGGPLTQPDRMLIRRMLNGFQSPGSPMAMPPKGGNPGLTERDLATLVDYMRSTFKP